jgi:hypothetical protein
MCSSSIHSYIATDNIPHFKTAMIFLMHQLDRKYISNSSHSAIEYLLEIYCLSASENSQAFPVPYIYMS